MATMRLTMLRSGAAPMLALAVGSLLAAAPAAPPPQPATPQTGATWAPDAQAPTEAEVHERAAKLTDNQHDDDTALDQYERIEHYVERTGGPNSRVLLDKTYRMVPDGGGTSKLLIEDHGTPGDPQEYRRQLQTLADILKVMANPNDSRAKAAYEKYEKRKRDRAEFLDVARSAFIVKWQDREMWNGRTCDVFTLNSDPSFHPHSIFQDALAHVTAKIWVDRQTNQLARGEADVTSDTYFGGGILGRLSRGSKISMEQAEVAPGVWLPTRYQYDFSGRKFLFSFEQHETIEVTHYRRIGPPGEALAAIQKELAAGKPTPGDP
jgi:hypothetical protein